MASNETTAPDDTSRKLEELAHQNFGRLCLACGAAAPLLWGAMIWLTALDVEGYSHARNLISELGAGNSSGALAMRVLGFAVTGMLYVVCAAYVGWRLRHDRAALIASLLLIVGGFARLGAGIYPCDPGCVAFSASATQEMHMIVVRIGYGAMILSTIAWGVTVNRYPALRWVSSVSFGCATWTIVCLVMLVTESSLQGQYQRFAAVLLGGWMLAFVSALWRAGLWRGELEWRRPDYAPRRRRFRR